MLRPILVLVRKEFRQVRRDPALLRIVLVLPLIQLFVFGYAANTDLRNVRLRVLDQDRSQSSRALVEAFRETDLFRPGPTAENPADLARSLAQGGADLTLWIPVGFAADLATGRPAPLGIALDGRQSSLAGRTAGYTRAILARAARRLAPSGQPGTAGEAGKIAGPGAVGTPRGLRTAAESGPQVVGRFFYNPELRSRYYMVPGIVVLIITIISGLLTGLAVVHEREIGTLEQLLVSPLTPLQLIAGKTIPFAILGFLDLAAATFIAVLWFHLPLAGSVLLLAGCALIYLLVTLGVGLLASTVSQTQQQAIFAVWFALVFGILMSGFFYPIENMPSGIRWMTYVNPLRYMMSIVRGIFLRGATAVDLAPEIGALAGLGVLIFGAAVLRFRKRLA